MQIIKVHFNTSSAARAASHNKTAYAGVRYKSGRIKTWIAAVEKMHAQETVDQARARFSK